MYKEANSRLKDSHTNGNSVVSEQYIRRMLFLTKQPKEGMRNHLIINEQHNKKMSK